MSAIEIDFNTLDSEFVGAVSLAYELACKDIAVFKVDPNTKKPTIKNWDDASSSDIEKCDSRCWSRCGG